MRRITQIIISYTGMGSENVSIRTCWTFFYVIHSPRVSLFPFFISFISSVPVCNCSAFDINIPWNSKRSICVQCTTYDKNDDNIRGFLFAVLERILKQLWIFHEYATYFFFFLIHVWKCTVHIQDRYVCMVCRCTFQ